MSDQQRMADAMKNGTGAPQLDGLDGFVIALLGARNILGRPMGSPSPRVLRLATPYEFAVDLRDQPGGGKTRMFAAFPLLLLADVDHLDVPADTPMIPLASCHPEERKWIARARHEAAQMKAGLKQLNSGLVLPSSVLAG